MPVTMLSANWQRNWPADLTLNTLEFLLEPVLVQPLSHALRTRTPDALIDRECLAQGHRPLGQSLGHGGSCCRCLPERVPLPGAGRVPAIAAGKQSSPPLGAVSGSALRRTPCGQRRAVRTRSSLLAC